MLAAALLLQAAALDHQTAAFDLASLDAEVMDGIEGALGGPIGPGDCGPGPLGEVVICGRGSRVDYRGELASPARAADRAPRGELLVDHTGCGTRQTVAGCFEGWVVLRVAGGGAVEGPGPGALR